MSVAYVCGVPADQYEVIRDEPQPERWCFGERKRRTGRIVVKRPTTEYLERTHAWGWAEPTWTYVCDGCGQDRRFGFGGYPVYGWEEDEA